MKHHQAFRGFRLGSLFLCAILAMTGGVQAGQEQPSGGVVNGVKLHGPWIIEIRNPDGALSSRHEFDNSLVSTGKSLLAAVFGKYAIQRWTIGLRNLPGIRRV